MEWELEWELLQMVSSSSVAQWLIQRWKPEPAAVKCKCLDHVRISIKHAKDRHHHCIGTYENSHTHMYHSHIQYIDRRQSAGNEVYNSTCKQRHILLWSFFKLDWLICHCTSYKIYPNNAHYTTTHIQLNSVIILFKTKHIFRNSNESE